jgi:hypothetical protein
MITKNHPSAYAELFEKAKKALSEYGSDKFKTAPMNNIDDYFACLAELARIENEYPEQIDPIFTILPATEQTFNIDADKRSIAIPENFAKYGVGVQGDEIAEILYFSIDRYFDAMDLAEMDIIVQWAHENDDNVNNLSATYKRSLTLQPGKIVFGWPITSEITERPGKINFSIRFYRRGLDANNNEILEYSFSTLTTTIKIQSGLDFELDEQSITAAYNKNSLIYKNLRNSKKAEIGYVIAAPSFTGYFVQVAEQVEGDNGEMVEVLRLVPTTPTNAQYDLPVTFVAKAAVNPANDDEYVSGAGLAYSWFKKVNTGDVEQNSAHLYVEVASNAVYNPNEIYYEKKTVTDPEQGSYEVYEPYYVTGDNNPMDDGVVLYTRHSKFVPEKAGTYYSKATNTYTVGAEKSIDSVTWVIPGAVAASFDYPSGKTALLDAEDGAELNVVASAATGETTVQWYYGDTNNADEAEAIEGATGNTCVADAEGFYFLKATNTRNADSIVSVSDSIEANFDASEPVINNYYINGTIQAPDATSYAAEIGNTLKVTIAPLNYTNQITYEWVRVAGETETHITNDSELQATEAGNYKCIVKNTYKGRDKVTSSKLFKV